MDVTTKQAIARTTVIAKNNRSLRTEVIICLEFAVVVNNCMRRGWAPHSLIPVLFIAINLL